MVSIFPTFANMTCGVFSGTCCLSRDMHNFWVTLHADLCRSFAWADLCRSIAFEQIFGDLPTSESLLILDLASIPLPSGVKGPCTMPSSIFM